MSSSNKFGFPHRDGYSCPQLIRTRSATQLDEQKISQLFNSQTQDPSLQSGSSLGVKRDIEDGSGRSADFNMESQTEQNARWPPRQHLRRSTSTSSSLYNLPLLGTSCVRNMLLWTILILGVMVSFTFIFPTRPFSNHVRMRGLYEKLDELLPDSHHADTLVIYVYSKSDTEYQRNLEFFVRNGMWEGDGCNYIIIVQQDTALFGSASLPQLPRNARYLFHENKCFDWGTFGWVFDETEINTDLYKSIIFMNSSVRGPFLPPYFPVGLHWSKLLTLRLSSTVKLVGSTISCEPAWEGGNTANEMRQNAHVQSYIMATDQVGLKALQDDGHVFACYDNMADTIYNAEVGASRIIFEQGYTIDSLMLKYQDVDWTNTTNWNCNAGLNPYAEYSLDGSMINPLEVIFVKVKGFQMQGGWLSAQMATLYDRWLSSEVAEGAANVNVYATKRMSFRLGRAITMLLRGNSCFDYNLYRAKSRDLPATLTDEQIWDHFVHDGQFEGRPFRFTCENPLDNPDFAERAFQEISKHTNNILPAAEAMIA